MTGPKGLILRLTRRIGFRVSGITHRPLRSSCLGLPYRILNVNHKKELLRGLWVGFRIWSVCAALSLVWARQMHGNASR